MDKVSQLIKYLNHSRQLEAATVESFLARINFSQSDLVEWQNAEVVQGTIEKQLIHQGNHYEIFLTSWGASTASDILQFPDISWGVVQLFGIAQVKSLAIKALTLSIDQTQERQLSSADCIALSVSSFVQFKALENQPFFTLHIFANEAATDGFSAKTQRFIEQKGLLQPKESLATEEAP